MWKSSFWDSGGLLLIRVDTDELDKPRIWFNIRKCNVLNSFSWKSSRKELTPSLPPHPQTCISLYLLVGWWLSSLTLSSFWLLRDGFLPASSFSHARGAGRWKSSVSCAVLGDAAGSWDFTRLMGDLDMLSFLFSLSSTRLLVKVSSFQAVVLLTGHLGDAAWERKKRSWDNQHSRIGKQVSIFPSSIWGYLTRGLGSSKHFLSPRQGRL